MHLKELDNFKHKNVLFDFSFRSSNTHVQIRCDGQKSRSLYTVSVCLRRVQHFFHHFMLFCFIPFNVLQSCHSLHIIQTKNLNRSMLTKFVKCLKQFSTFHSTNVWKIELRLTEDNGIVAINDYNFISLKNCKQKGGLKLIKVVTKECHAVKTIQDEKKEINPVRNPHTERPTNTGHNASFMAWSRFNQP